MSRRAGSALARRAAIHCRTNGTSISDRAMNTEEPVKSTNGRSAGWPTMAQNASRDWLGARGTWRF